MNRELMLLGLTALVGSGAASLCSVQSSGVCAPAWPRERRAWRWLISPHVGFTVGDDLLAGLPDVLR